ncbi:bifunctional phosphoglucose/phosphomannose isomerase [Fodinibius sp.]|uniref:bifunctional phosphoglucose/phosphomannose isomerase n=1 Tax=Fodinibius sp. TaxID=1872440 RepID=UPI002ACE34C2|nr:bifunctional phosphoglucose/phosphomannose isomerase [Fodinibius sp.]MDZ7658661.1 bifunctional phosphoglucose/phosphomannose isomerase [Fodinibius sp.]
MNLEDIKSIDSQNMWDILTTFPEQWKEAVESTKNIDLNIDKERISNICFAGMGGSAIGPDLIKGFCYHQSPYPIKVVRHYEIPEWVNENTLFIACSFSGTTEETLTALATARERGAQIIAVTAGGKLMVQATKEEFDYIKIPGGMPPRAALGYSFVPLYRIFQYLGIVDERDGALKDTARFLFEQNEVLSNHDDNEALNLAEEIIDSLPIIYSDATMMQPVNLRWQNQFAENAKTLSFGNSLPEMTHNKIVGWERIAHLTGRLSVILLIDREDNPRVQRRMEIVEELIEDQTSSLHILETRGQTRLTRMFSLIQLADWTSFYLAILSNVDPTPIAKIDLLKSKLA